jgi:exodeoxyribonuclease X
MMPMIGVIDVETTGLDPAIDRVVEIAMAEVDLGDQLTIPMRVGKWWSAYVNPGCPISPEASAVHHIVDRDVVASPGLEEVLELAKAGEGVEIMAAHNCRFDRSFLPMFHGKKWIDTYRCAMHLWPDAPNFQLQTLRYWLKLDLPHGRAHEAANDVVVAAHILIKQLGERSVDDLLLLSTKACSLKKVGFGKHFGKLWTEVPMGYLEWAAKQDRDFDPDVRFTVRTELARRAWARTAA